MLGGSASFDREWGSLSSLESKRVQIKANDGSAEERQTNDFVRDDDIGSEGVSTLPVESRPGKGGVRKRYNEWGDEILE
jgi:hypothetical protein